MGRSSSCTEESRPRANVTAGLATLALALVLVAACSTPFVVRDAEAATAAQTKLSEFSEQPKLAGYRAAFRRRLLHKRTEHY